MKSDIKYTVDVIMLTYQHEKFINDALNGVISQRTDFDFRLLIFDDSSTDNTNEIVLKKDNSNPRLFIYYQRNPKNLGSSINGQNALRLSDANYIALCEGDDYWTDPYKLQKQVDLLEKHDNASMVFSNCQVLVNGNINEINLKYPEYFSFSEYLQLYNAIPTCTMVFRRNCFDLNDKTIELLKKCPVGDFPLRFLIGDKGDFIFLPESTAVYRKHDGGISNNFHNSNHYVGILRMYKILNSYFNFKYDYFLGIHLQDTFERLFYVYCTEKLILAAIKTFYKACIDFDGKFLKPKRCLNILKHGVKEFIRK
jgi:glycosyltransferase involved in cell wall biosynthesis